MSDDLVVERFAAVEELAHKILKQLQHEVDKLGFDYADVQLQTVDDAFYRLDQDPANGEYSLVGDWRDDHGMKTGMLLFHADGSFFVEQDIVRPHPTKAQWFVEAVNAWGRDSSIKAEARLLPAVTSY